MTFNEASLEEAILELLGEQGYPHSLGETITRSPEEVLIQADLERFLTTRYAAQGITEGEITGIIAKLKAFSAADLYDSNREIMKMVSDGFLLKREDPTQTDLFIELLDYGALKQLRQSQEGDVIGAAPPTETSSNIFRMVNQLEIFGQERRIPDGILYINGLPLVVFEFKSATREKVSIHDAYVQLTTRYRRDIPELFKYNAFCVISDGVNNKVGSFFAPYEFFYAWRKTDGDDLTEAEGINSLSTMVEGLFDQVRILDVIRNFIYLPDVSRSEQKILCRYPQYYATRKLFENILAHRKPDGDGKGGTYFGATGCGKSFTMLFLARLLMRSVELASPTIVLITDRTDLDDQLSSQFTNAKDYLGDASVMSVESRSHLRDLLKDRVSGGVFLTTIHKFTEDTELLTERSNVICISDEAHRSQVNLEQKLRVTEAGVEKTYGFAKYLHDSLPNATYVGFTGTPIDATLDVFGPVVEAYTMTESVADEITVRIVYEGRAAKVILDNSKLQDIETYYDQCAAEGASEHAIEDSKRATANMNSILGDPDRLKALAADFVDHYETRVEEGSTVAGKAMFVSSSRQIAYEFYKEVIALRPDWAELRTCAEGMELSEQEARKVKPMERIKMVMTRGQDDEAALYEMLGTSDYRKELDRQFKNAKSNFKIAIVVDMWLTGFDVPFLDTIYIDKPVQRHNLIQTISRVNRKFEDKQKGLVVDYIGIKKAMNKALAQYTKSETQSLEDVKASIDIVRDQLELLDGIFYLFNTSPYFNGTSLEKLQCLNQAAEHVQSSKDQETRFMELVKRLKAAYDICSGSGAFSEGERDLVYFYFAVRSIIAKLTKEGAPDTAKMNAKVRELIAEAIKSDGVEEIFKMGEEGVSEIDIFEDDYLAKIEKIKLPNTKIKLLQQMMQRAVADFSKVNRAKGMDFSKKLRALVEKYNERDETDVLRGEELAGFADEIITLLGELKTEMQSYEELGIDIEEKAFFDILFSLAVKYEFEYPEDKLLELATKVKEEVDNTAKYTDWHSREDIKAELKANLIMLLADNGYPPVDRDEVYKEIFEQAQNFKVHRAA